MMSNRERFIKFKIKILNIIISMLQLNNRNRINILNRKLIEEDIKQKFGNGRRELESSHDINILSSIENKIHKIGHFHLFKIH